MSNGGCGHDDMMSNINQCRITPRELWSRQATTTKIGYRTSFRIQNKSSVELAIRYPWDAMHLDHQLKLLLSRQMEPRSTCICFVVRMEGRFPQIAWVVEGRLSGTQPTCPCQKRKALSLHHLSTFWLIDFLSLLLSLCCRCVQYLSFQM